jgi:biopolymer transport protein ExbD
MQLPDEPDSPPQINIVPMIDVIFAILTFFIMATLFLNRSEGLLVNLPQAQTGKAQRSTRATVTIDKQGQLALNRQSIQLERLSKAVRQLAQPNQNLVVILNADEAVRHGRVVQVMDQLRQVKGVKLAIATQRP